MTPIRLITLLVLCGSLAWADAIVSGKWYVGLACGIVAFVVNLVPYVPAPASTDEEK